MGVCQSCQANKPRGSKNTNPLKDQFDDNPTGSRAIINKEDFIKKGQSNKKIEFLMNKINGNQIIIEDCHSCQIYLIDHTSTVSITKSDNCNIMIGPCKSRLLVYKA